MIRHFAGAVLRAGDPGPVNALVRCAEASLASFCLSENNHLIGIEVHRGRKFGFVDVAPNYRGEPS